MFQLLPLRSWLDLPFGFLFGVISTALVVKILNQLKKKQLDHPELIITLVFYSFSMAVVASLYASALSGGLLEEWQRLQFQKGSERATKILDIGYIQGKSGNLYMYNQGILERIDAIPEYDNFEVVPMRSNCGALPFLPILKRDFVASKSACLGFGSTDVKVAYAIDSRGYVYLWQHKAHEFGGLENLIVTISGGIVSCVFGVIVLLLLVFLQMLKRRIQKNTVQSISAVLAVI